MQPDLTPLPTWADDRLRWLYKGARLVLEAYRAGELVAIPRVSPFTSYHRQLADDAAAIASLEAAFGLPDAVKEGV